MSKKKKWGGKVGYHHWVFNCGFRLLSVFLLLIEKSFYLRKDESLNNWLTGELRTNKNGNSKARDWAENHIIISEDRVQMLKRTVFLRQAKEHILA